MDRKYECEYAESFRRHRYEHIGNEDLPSYKRAEMLHACKMSQLKKKNKPDKTYNPNDTNTYLAIIRRYKNVADTYTYMAMNVNIRVNVFKTENAKNLFFSNQNPKTKFSYNPNDARNQGTFTREKQETFKKRLESIDKSDRFDKEERKPLRDCKKLEEYPLFLPLPPSGLDDRRNVILCTVLDHIS